MRTILICIGLGLGLIATELGLRIYYPQGAIPAAHLETTSDEKLSSFQQDDECGYLPIIGRGEYGPHGCLPNDYDVEKPQGRRLLFVGDSVTHRARIIKALRKLYGEENYEYWNAGVESFNTLQEWVLYRKHNHRIKPDHVILTFHNNDFRATPMVVRERGQIKIYQPGLDINPWLFKHSYVYRWAWPKSEDKEDRARQVLEGLTGFRDALAEENIKFTVVLHPMLRPLDQWEEKDNWSRELSLQYFQDLGLDYIDLLPTLKEALTDGIEITEAPGDYLHPNDEMARRFSETLQEQNILE